MDDTVASGKSEVCSLLKDYGFHVLDADKIGHAWYVWQGMFAE